MKILRYLLLVVLFFNLFSCVEDEVVFREKEDSISFGETLFSVAIDEMPRINVRITKFDGTDNSDAYDISYRSDNEDVFTLTDEGQLIPKTNALGDKAEVIVTATLKDDSVNLQGTLTNEEQLVPKDSALGKSPEVRVTTTLEDQELNNEIELTPFKNDEIKVGLVTITEREAILKTDEELEEIVINGYEPRGVIGNKVSEIDIESNDMVLSVTFFNFKNKDLIDPDVTWVSSDASIIEVDENGRLTPIALGNAVITVSTEIDGETVEAPPLSIEVGGETIIVDQPQEEEAEVLGFGTLMTNSFYDVEGTFRIEKEDGVTRLILNDNFETDSLPDLVIYLSNSTSTNTGAVVISDEIQSRGAQTFTISDNVNVDNYSNVLLFCRRFNQRVGFGVINR